MQVKEVLLKDSSVDRIRLMAQEVDGQVLLTLTTKNWPDDAEKEVLTVTQLYGEQVEALRNFLNGLSA